MKIAKIEKDREVMYKAMMLLPHEPIKAFDLLRAQLEVEDIQPHEAHHIKSRYQSEISEACGGCVIYQNEYLRRDLREVSTRLGNKLKKD